MACGPDRSGWISDYPITGSPDHPIPTSVVTRPTLSSARSREEIEDGCRHRLWSLQRAAMAAAGNTHQAGFGDERSQAFGVSGRSRGIVLTSDNQSGAGDRPQIIGTDFATR